MSAIWNCEHNNEVHNANTFKDEFFLFDDSMSESNPRNEILEDKDPDENIQNGVKYQLSFIIHVCHVKRHADDEDEK